MNTTFKSNKVAIIELPAEDLRKWKQLQSEEGSLILLSILAPIVGAMLLSMYLGRHYEIDAMALWFCICFGGFFLFSFIKITWDNVGPKKKVTKISRRQQEKKEILIRNGWDGKTPWRFG